jgi:hypothetical protein
MAGSLATGGALRGRAAGFAAICRGFGRATTFFLPLRDRAVVLFDDAFRPAPVFLLPRAPFDFAIATLLSAL